MDGKKKIWATAVLCAVASVGFVVPAGAEERRHDHRRAETRGRRGGVPRRHRGRGRPAQDCRRARAVRHRAGRFGQAGAGQGLRRGARHSFRWRAVPARHRPQGAGVRPWDPAPSPQRVTSSKQGLAPSPLWGEEPAPGLNGGGGEGLAALDAPLAGMCARRRSPFLCLAKERNQRKATPLDVSLHFVAGNLRCSVLGRRCGTRCAAAPLRSDSR